ncbi:MAG: hypothetical protein WC196_02875 [Bacilli bacterium]
METEYSNEIHFRARRGDFNCAPDTINLYVRQKCGNEFFAAEKLKLTIVKERYSPIEPFASIDTHQAQKLMDDLWDCGLRPSEGTGSAGQLRSTQDHLADMRKIVFKKLGIIS